MEPFRPQIQAENQLKRLKNGEVEPKKWTFCLNNHQNIDRQHQFNHRKRLIDCKLLEKHFGSLDILENLKSWIFGFLGVT